MRCKLNKQEEAELFAGYVLYNKKIISTFRKPLYLSFKTPANTFKRTHNLVVSFV